jgi:hypothetical protein
LYPPTHKSRAGAADADAAAPRHLRINARRAVMRKCLGAAAEVNSRRRSCPALSCSMHQSSSVGVRGTVCLARSLPQNGQLLGIRCSHGRIMNQSEAIVNTSILVRTRSKWSR